MRILRAWGAVAAEEGGGGLAAEEGVGWEWGVC